MIENGPGGAGTLELGGDLRVNRLGFGAMRLCGPGVWGEPEDPRVAEAVLRRAVELGVNLIDTARLHSPGSGPLEDQRAPEAPARGVRGQPQAPQTRPHRPLPAPPPG